MYGIIVYTMDEPDISLVELTEKIEKQKFLSKYKAKIIHVKMTSDKRYVFLLNNVDNVDSSHFYNREKFEDKELAKLAFELL